MRLLPFVAAFSVVLIMIIWEYLFAVATVAAVALAVYAKYALPRKVEDQERQQKLQKRVYAAAIALAVVAPLHGSYTLYAARQAHNEEMARLAAWAADMNVDVAALPALIEAAGSEKELRELARQGKKLKIETSLMPELVKLAGGIEELEKAAKTGARDVASVSAYVQRRDKEKAAVEACKKDWKRCRSQEDLANNWGGMSTAQARCITASKQMARFGEPDFPWGAFGSLNNSEDSRSSGVIHLYETEAKFKNGFNAPSRVSLECVYNLAGEKVVSVQVR